MRASQKKIGLIFELDKMTYKIYMGSHKEVQLFCLHSRKPDVPRCTYTRCLVEQAKLMIFFEKQIRLTIRIVLFHMPPAYLNYPVKDNNSEGDGVTSPSPNLQQTIGSAS